MAAPRQILGHYREDSQPHSPDVNHCVLHFRPENYRESRKEVWTQSPVERLVGFAPATFRFLLQRLNPLGHSILQLKPATSLKVTLLHECFSRFLNCKNGTYSRNASHLQYEKYHLQSLFKYFKIVTAIKQESVHMFSKTTYFVFKNDKQGPLVLLRPSNSHIKLSPGVILVDLTQISLVLHFIQKPVTWLAEQEKNNWFLYEMQHWAEMG